MYVHVVSIHKTTHECIMTYTRVTPMVQNVSTCVLRSILSPLMVQRAFLYLNYVNVFPFAKISWVAFSGMRS